MSATKMTYAAAVVASLHAKIASASQVEEPKCVWRYGRYRPNGKFDNSDDESEARAEWIESRKDRDQRD